MKKSILHFSVATFFTATFFLNACKPKEEVELADLSSEQDITTMQSDFDNVMDIVNDAIDNHEQNNSNYRTMQSPDTSIKVGDCLSGTATLYLDSIVNGYQHVLVINYATSSGICNDLGSREGKIIAYIKGRRINGDFADSVIFEGYKYKTASGVTRKLIGYKTVKQSASTADSWTFNIYVNGSVNFSSDNSTLTYTSTRTRKRTGISTRFDWTDDQLEISGTASATNRSGDNITHSVDAGNPLVFKGSCISTLKTFRYPVSGKITFNNVTKGITRSIDYGDGACDRNATFTSNNGNTFNFVMR